MASFNTAPAVMSSNVQTMDISQALQNMSLDNAHNFRAIEATVVTKNVDSSTGEEIDPIELDRLATEIQDIQTIFHRTTQQTLELKGSMRSAYDLSFDLEVWEQLPIEQQMEYGKLEEAIRANDFLIEFLQPFVDSLRGLFDARRFCSLEAKLILLRPHIPMIEGNIVMVAEKLEEKALAKELDEMKI